MSDLRTLGKAMRDAQRAYENARYAFVPIDAAAKKAAEAAFDKALEEPLEAYALGIAKAVMDEASDKALSEPPAPGMTDLMVTPESIDAFIEANPLPSEPPAALAEIEKKPKKETMHMNEQINMHVEALTGLLRELCPNQTGDLLAKQVAATVRIAVLNAEQEAAVKAGTNDAGPQP